MTHPTTATTPDSTKEALLDAAERLFADQGITSTSVRAVTRAASANVAAVNYHFGSKEELILAVLERRLGPLNAERLERLDRVESSENGATVEAILRALVIPAFQLSEAGLRRFTKMLARCHFDPDPTIQDLIASRFETVVERFAGALSRALPELSPNEIMFRFHFAIGAMAMAVANRDAILRHSRGQIEPAEVEDVSRLTNLLVEFLAHGFRAPAIGGGAQ